jgi:hypothetical protein
MSRDVAKLALKLLNYPGYPHTNQVLQETFGWTKRKVQLVVQEACEEGYPICSSSHRSGYWWPESREEAQAAIDERRRRAVKQLVVIRKMEKGLDKWLAPIQLELVDA